MRTGLSLLAAAALLAACASMNPAPASVADGVLVGPNRMTLYTFDRDATGSGKSACNGPCATNWPPLMASAGDRPSGDWTVVVRDDARSLDRVPRRPAAAVERAIALVDLPVGVGAQDGRDLARRAAEIGADLM